MAKLGEEFEKTVRPMLDTVDHLRTLFANTNIKIELPTIAVMGIQSAGKSSLLERLSGVDLPRGEGTVTRAALTLVMRRCKPGEQPSAEIGCGDKFPMKTIPFAKVADKIREITEEVAPKDGFYADHAINLRIVKDDVPDLTLIDMPGIKYDSQMSDAAIKALYMKYIKSESCVILCALQVGTEAQTQQTLQWAREVDPTGSRTIIALTKIDAVAKLDKSILIRLRGEGFEKGSLGIVAVRNRSQEDVEKNLPIEQVEKQEKQFFEENEMLQKLTKEEKEKCLGTPALVRLLLEVQGKAVQDAMPGIKNKIGKLLHKKKKQLDAFPKAFTTEMECSIQFHELLTTAATILELVCNAKISDARAKAAFETPVEGIANALRRLVGKLDGSGDNSDDNDDDDDDDNDDDDNDNNNGSNAGNHGNTKNNVGKLNGAGSKNGKTAASSKPNTANRSPNNAKGDNGNDDDNDDDDDDDDGDADGNPSAASNLAAQQASDPDAGAVDDASEDDYSLFAYRIWNLTARLRQMYLTFAKQVHDSRDDPTTQEFQKTLLETINESRGSAMPDQLSPVVFDIYTAKDAEAMVKPAQNLIDKAHKYMLLIVKQIVAHVFAGFPNLLEAITNGIVLKLQEQLNKCKQHLQTQLQMEKKPLTFNHYYMDTLAKLHALKAKKSKKPKRKTGGKNNGHDEDEDDNDNDDDNYNNDDNGAGADDHDDDVTSDGHGDNLGVFKTNPALKKMLATLAGPGASNDNQLVAETILRIIVYRKVVEKRFIDQIVNSVQLYFPSEMTAQFSAFLISHLSKEGNAIARVGNKSYSAAAKNNGRDGDYYRHDQDDDGDGDDDEDEEGPSLDQLLLDLMAEPANVRQTRERVQRDLDQLQKGVKSLDEMAREMRLANRHANAVRRRKTNKSK